MTSGNYTNLDRTNNAGVYSAKSVTTSASLLAVGAGSLSGRDFIVIQPQDGNIYIGFNNSVTTSTGTIVGRRQTLQLAAGENIEIWAIAASGTINVRILEVS